MMQMVSDPKWARMFVNRALNLNTSDPKWARMFVNRALNLNIDI